MSTPTTTTHLRVVPFEELTTRELYAILRLRAAVFVVEQACVYQDLDGLDVQALHVLRTDSHGQLLAYCRVFVAREPHRVHRLGRVIVEEGLRRTGLGRRIVLDGIEVLERCDATIPIAISAQARHEGFYVALGFRTVGSAYDEDGIPHLPMQKAPRSSAIPFDVLIPRLARPEGTPALRVGSLTLDDRGLAVACQHHLERLEAEGVGPGAVVGVVTEPRIETLVALVAQLAAGIITVPIDPKLGPLELGHVLADARPELIVSHGPVEGSAIRTLAPELGAGQRGVVATRPISSTPALLLYTSGTTGKPKGALLSTANLVACLDGLREAWQWNATDTVVHALPVFHVHGLVLGLLGSLRAGGMLHWLPRFSTEAIADALLQVTPPRRGVLFAVPTMIHRLAESAESDLDVRDALAAARLVVSGSAALSLRDHELVTARTGKRVVERYGMTETLITLAIRADAPRPGFVGHPLRGVEARLLDEDGGVLDVADDESIGEIAVRGPTVFLGYLNRPEATAEVLDAEGWFRTGDLATRTPDGAFRIVGRRSTDLIKCGGFKVGAGEVEAALLEHPEVREAAVVAAPDADLGERIVAFVVVRSPACTAESLIQHVAGLLSPHKRPREVHLVDELPRNAMGKVQKKLLAAHLGR